MNRLIIVGNGFDLAHGLPTGYCDFIDWYWRGVFANFKINIRGGYFEDKTLKIELRFRPRYYKEDEDFLEHEISSINSYKTLMAFMLREEDTNDYLEIHYFNKFFKTINEKRTIQNWVDIENEYYKLLKECLAERNNIMVKKLNKDFEEVKKLLEEYLFEQVGCKYDFNQEPDNINLFTDIIKLRHRNLSGTTINDYLREFPSDDYHNLKRIDECFEIYEQGKTNNITELITSRNLRVKNLFLNFNYTFTLNSYLNLLSNSINEYFGDNSSIQIHGRLKDPENQINFGFGDEMDDHYKLIENKDDNEYLRNIKSFQYLQNSNYRDMLDFIDSDKFQVYIMGHSCGLSDRILLNKIFEHHNCRSIKVFYYQFDKPKSDGRTDDYTDIVQNISRHFNKKEMMREKIVNKSLCQPLPQTIRFAKKENGPQS